MSRSVVTLLLAAVLLAVGLSVAALTVALTRPTTAERPAATVCTSASVYACPSP